MEQVRNKGVAVEELGANFLTMLSSSIVDKFEKELEKKGMLFTPELSEQLRKLIVESYNDIQASSPSPMTEEEVVTATPILEQLVEETLPPLVFQVDCHCIVMGMMINGKPEVVKNEKGSRKTPAYSGFTDDNRLVYGTDAQMHHDFRGCRYDFWSSLKRGGPNQTFNLKEFGVFDLPALFFPAFLIRKLKITAEESQCNGKLGQCQAAILAVPLQITSADRLHLKEAALLAGFKDVYVISAEGLAAYYWFHKNETEREENNYSKDFVVINFSRTAVLYKRSFESGVDGKKNLVVTPIVLPDYLGGFHCNESDRDESLEMMTILKKAQENGVIPVVGGWNWLLLSSYLPQSLVKNKFKNVPDEELDPSKYFPAKGAALLSENPEKIGRQVRNMMEIVKIEPISSEPPASITRRIQILPATFAQQTFNFKHDRRKYRIFQNYETVGHLVINGEKFGLDLQVSYELSWEGILKVVGVSAKNPSDDDEDYKAVSWEWLIVDKVCGPQSGSISYEDFKLLLMKLEPSPSQANVASTEDDSSGGLPPQALDGAVEVTDSVCNSGDGNGKGKMLATKSNVTQPNDMNRCKNQEKLLNMALPSTSPVKRRSARLTKVGVTPSGSGSSQGQSVGLGSSRIDSGDGNEMQEKKRSRKGRVIRTTDLIVNTGLKKIKLESDWVEPVVKIEQDSVDFFGEDGIGHLINFEEHEIEIEEDVVKIEVEEEDNVTD